MADPVDAIDDLDPEELGYTEPEWEDQIGVECARHGEACV